MDTPPLTVTCVEAEVEVEYVGFEALPCTVKLTVYIPGQGTVNDALEPEPFVDQYPHWSVATHDTLDELKHQFCVCTPLVQSFVVMRVCLPHTGVKANEAVEASPIQTAGPALVLASVKLG
jgi:hypothetical protein